MPSTAAKTIEIVNPATSAGTNPRDV